MGNVSGRLNEIIPTLQNILEPRREVVEDVGQNASVGAVNQKVREINNILGNLSDEIFDGVLPIVTDNIASGAITQVVTATSASSVSPSTTETTLVSANITTTGGTVLAIALCSIHFNNTGADIDGIHKVDNSTTALDTRTSGAALNAGQESRNCSIVIGVETPAAGTYTYRSRGVTGSATVNIHFLEHKIILIELKR